MHIRRLWNTAPGATPSRRALLAGLVAAGAVSAVRARAAPSLSLLMFETPGCAWCRRWDAEIAPIYPRTEAGRAAPLRRLDIHAPLPEGVGLSRPAVFTPTFVLLRDGREAGRIEGYAGEAFFWGLLDQMLAEATE
ncbi:thioredoxin family protein [Albimonas pacifica]|uniref:SoxS protein n=1 Tax=Albimonas pacifica TaxID=1114924 RepID=A0A1I3H515_9RHOB|nr:thioredoxin family protein [Albimonas pacifica]SFI30868.1 hypothetical protein SAMN05216258_105507 [Albimonas pacifica]